MTFNEGIRIDTSNTSTSGGGGGGGGGRGIAVGGGMVGLIILLLTLFLGGDPGSVLSQQAIEPQGGVEAPGFDLSQCRTGKDANDIIECRMIATGNSVDGVWSQLMKGYTPPHMKLFKDSTDTGCGPATTDVGPFYCPVDQTAYFDTGFFEVLVEPIRFQRWAVGPGVRGRPRVRPPRPKPAGEPGQGAAGTAGRRRQQRAHRTAGRLLRRRVGPLRGHHQAARHRRHVPGTVERPGTFRTPCRPPRRSATTGSRRSQPAGSTRSPGRTAPPGSGRPGSPPGTRPVTRTSATPSAPRTSTTPEPRQTAKGRQSAGNWRPLRLSGGGYSRDCALMALSVVRSGRISASWVNDAMSRPSSVCTAPRT